MCRFFSSLSIIRDHVAAPKRRMHLWLKIFPMLPSVGFPPPLPMQRLPEPTTLRKHTNMNNMFGLSRELLTMEKIEDAWFNWATTRSTFVYKYSLKHTKEQVTKLEELTSILRTGLQVWTKPPESRQSERPAQVALDLVSRSYKSQPCPQSHTHDPVAVRCWQQNSLIRAAKKRYFSNKNHL